MSQRCLQFNLPQNNSDTLPKPVSLTVFPISVNDTSVLVAEGKTFCPLPNPQSPGFTHVTTGGSSARKAGMTGTAGSLSTLVCLGLLQTLAWAGFLEGRPQHTISS